MSSPITFQIVSGGFNFAVAGGFSVALSWLTCFISYAGIHLGSKVVRVYRKHKK
jgi:hypothetical protein